MGKIYQVRLLGYKSEQLMIDLCNTQEQMESMTVLQLKEKVVQRMYQGAGVDALRLIFADQPLDEDSKSLSHYGVQHLSLIHMVLRVPGGMTA